MMDAWMMWLDEYGYMDGVDRDSLDADTVRMMGSDYLDSCDEVGVSYDDDITDEMIAWVR